MKIKQVLIILLLALMGFEFGSRLGLMDFGLEQATPSRRDQKAERYWLEAGFNQDHFNQLLPATHCEIDKQSQLACQMALEKMKYQCDLSTLIDHQAIGVEREEAKYLKGQPQLDASAFSQQVDQILASCPVTQKPYALAQAINAFLSIYRDPHSYIMPYDYFQNVIASKDQRGLRFGLSIKRDQHLNWRIARVDRPIERNGQKINTGDEVLVVQGFSSSQVTSRWLHEQLQNAPQLSLKIKADGLIKQVTILPKQEDPLNVNHQWVSESRGIGLIRIERFARSTCQDFKIQLLDLKAQNLRGLILDLRDNPGGSVDEAACIMDLLVPKRQLLFMTFEQLTETPQIYLSKKNPLYRGPLTILVNANSASASEIVAGGLQAIGRAKIAGQRTFGKGTYQDGEIWSALDSIIVFETKGYYVFANQKTAQLVGVNPDIHTPSSVEWMREQDLYLYPVAPNYIDSKQQIPRLTKNFINNKAQAFSWNQNFENTEEHCLEDTQNFEQMIQVALKTFDCESKRYGSP